MNDLQVQFLTGGTQTNLLTTSTMLRRYEAVLAAETGHINVHEAGAIEYSGHKVITLPSVSGKVSGDDLEEYMEKFYGDDTHDHMSIPGMVYISHPSKLGVLYSKAELKNCRMYAVNTICLSIWTAHGWATVL